jgi:murein DD-endopeptidase MepM/ murein hydrolase activator NlpD
MRAKMTGIFVLGFACGVLVLTMALWFSGGLRMSSVFAGNKLPAPPPVLTPPDAGNPAPVVTPAAPPVEGTAAPGLHLAMPIAGVDPEELEDTFSVMRDGHKHEALDIPAPRGTPVMAVAEGNVVKLFTSKPGGLTVYQFDNSQTYCYYYAHLDRYAAGLKENTLLRKGDVLGYVGSTGNASPEAPHLHFAVTKLGPDKKWWEGTAIDPLPLLR